MALLWAALVNLYHNYINNNENLYKNNDDKKYQLL